LHQLDAVPERVVHVNAVVPLEGFVVPHRDAGGRQPEPELGEIVDAADERPPV
jgi:hypothetical protein